MYLRLCEPNVPRAPSALAASSRSASGAAFPAARPWSRSSSPAALRARARGRASCPRPERVPPPRRVAALPRMARRAGREPPRCALFQRSGAAGRAGGAVRGGSWGSARQDLPDGRAGQGRGRWGRPGSRKPRPAPAYDGAGGRWCRVCWSSSEKGCPTPRAGGAHCPPGRRHEVAAAWRYPRRCGRRFAVLWLSSTAA